MNGDGSTISLVNEIGTTNIVVGRWVKKYRTYDESAFDELNSNNSYTKKFKQMICECIPTELMIISWFDDTI